MGHRMYQIPFGQAVSHLIDVRSGSLKFVKVIYAQSVNQYVYFAAVFRKVGCEFDPGESVVWILIP